MVSFTTSITKNANANVTHLKLNVKKDLCSTTDLVRACVLLSIVKTASIGQLSSANVFAMCTFVRHHNTGESTLRIQVSAAANASQHTALLATTGTNWLVNALAAHLIQAHAMQSSTGTANSVDVFACQKTAHQTAKETYSC